MPESQIVMTSAPVASSQQVNNSSTPITVGTTATTTLLLGPSSNNKKIIYPVKLEPNNGLLKRGITTQSQQSVMLIPQQPWIAGPVVKKVKVNSKCTATPESPDCKCDHCLRITIVPNTNGSWKAGNNASSDNNQPMETDNGISSLNVLADEAARRALSPRYEGAAAKLSPRFVSGPFIQGVEQIDVRRAEVVCQHLCDVPLNGKYVIVVVHSHREFRGNAITADASHGFADDTEAIKKWPLRAWTDSSYNTEYRMLEIPKLGVHRAAIITMCQENVVNMRFPVLSSDRSNYGHKKHGRLWEEIIFPLEKLKVACDHWVVTPIQIVAELRDPKKLKKPKRSLQHLPYFASSTATCMHPVNQSSDNLMTSSGSCVGKIEDKYEDDLDEQKFVIPKSSEWKFDLASADLMSDEDLMEAAIQNTKKHCLLLPRDHLELFYKKTMADLAVAQQHFAQDMVEDEAWVDYYYY